MSGAPSDSAPPVRGGETLGRRVSDTPGDRRGYWRRIRQNPDLIPRDVFKPTLKSRTAAGNFCVSTDRLDAAESPGESAAIADREADEAGEIFYGWAAVSAEAAGRDGRRVCPSPTDSNPFHADIVLPEGPRGEKDTRRRHALALAENALWRPRPAG